jgi:hypothetical protein
MLLKDQKHKCNIFNKFLVDDLLPYRVVNSRKGTHIQYRPITSTDTASKFVEETPNSVPSDNELITFNIKAITSLYEDNLANITSTDTALLTDSDYVDVWLPLIISKDISNQYILNKPVFNNTVINNQRLGIENFIKFNTLFRNWTSSGTTTQMTIDWILNSSLANIDAEYGLLCWIKLGNSLGSKQGFPWHENGFYNLNRFPKYSRLLCTGNGKQYIKLDDNTLFDINTDDSVFLSNSIDFINDTNRVLVSSLPTNSRFGLITSELEHVEQYPLGGDRFYYGFYNVEFWIPDGDFFSYFDNSYDKNTSQNKTIPISSRSYLSPTLYSRYAHIYNILTLNEKKNLNRGRHLSRSRLLKRLCYALATSPLMDGITHDFLASESNLALVNTYLSSNPYNISDEISGLRNILQTLCKKFKLLNIGLKKKTLASNHILTRSGLFKKLLNKYSASLFIENSALTLTYGSTLDSSDILINQSIYNYLKPGPIPSNNNVDPALDGIVDNHQTITINNVAIQSTSTGLSISSGSKTKSIPSTNSLKPILTDIPFGIGDDQIEQYKEGGELKISLTGITDIRLGDPSLNASVRYVWELIDGPCLRFGDYTRDKYRQARFSYSNDYNPELYVYGPGKYTIKCSISSEYGKIFDIKTIYVVEARGGAKNIGTYDGINTPPDPIIHRDLVHIIGVPYHIIFPNLNQVAVNINSTNNKGVFWPLKTDLYIGKFGSFATDKFTKLAGSTKFPFDTEGLSSNSNTLSLKYDPGANSCIKIDRIILSHITGQCLPFYKELLVQNDPTYAREQRYPDGFDLPTYDDLGYVIPGSNITFDYPRISTDYSPEIKSYGGYPIEILNSGLNIVRPPLSSIPGLYHGSNLPHITGHKLDYDKKICFELEPTGLINPILVDKGVFHPGSGFIKSTGVTTLDWNNKSSVLKFNPAARKCFNFVGAGFEKLISSHDNDGYNIANVFKSSISVNIDPAVQPDPPPTISDTDSDSVRKKKLDGWKDGNQKKELPDHDVNHGYRSLDNGYNMNSDEFGYDASFLQKTDPYCDGSSVTYSFKSIGTKLVPTGTSTPSAGELKLQNVTLPTNISDIEVKLNFLNYINTKNLVIWLDVQVCPAENCKIINAKPPGSYRKSGGIPYVSTSTNTYLTSLSNMNKDLRLYLLNQEYVQNNTYNFSLKFSNHASKLNKPSDSNIMTSGCVPHHQHIIKNEMELLPTTMASGYSDLERSIYYQRLLDHTDINDTNRKTMGANNFTKYEGLELFGGCDPDRPVPPNGTTTFTLNIAVLDEHDDMKLYDNITNSDLLTGFKTAINKQQSSIISNSLCNWELILRTGPNSYPEHKNDPIGLIEYSVDSSGNMKDPQYPGYSFIANFKDQKHLLPLVNHNAPFTFINNTNLCKLPLFELNKDPLYKTIEFPTTALLQILINTSVIYGGGGVLGLIFGNPDPGYRELYNYFTQSRLATALNTANLAVDRPNYNRYSFGGPDKILLNVSKDKIVWYKLEASIFKYSNTPALEPNNYKYLRLNRSNAFSLSQFSFSILSESDLINNELLESLQKKTFTTNVITKTTGIPGDLQDQDIVKLSGQDKTTENGYYIIGSTWEKIPDGISRHPVLSAYYITRYGSIFSNLTTKIKNKTLIIIPNKKAFDLFDVNDTLVFFKSSDARTSTNTTNITLVAKALIIKDNKYYTVFELGSSFADYDTFTFNNNMLLVFKNNTTYSSDNDPKPFDKWALDKNFLGPVVPEDNFSLMGAGTYGYGSPFVRPDLLTDAPMTNKLKNIHEMFNSKENAFSINSTVLLSDGSAIDKNAVVENITANFKGFSYDIDESDNEIFINNNYITNIDDVNLDKTLYNSILNSIKTQKSIFYLKHTEGTFNYNYGTLKIEGDFIPKSIIKYLSQSDVDQIYNRTTFLEGTGTQDIRDKIGNKNQTDYIIDGGSIANLEDHYNSLTDHDPAICFDKTNTDNSTCYKKKIKQAIRDRYNERTNLIKALEDNAKLNSTGSAYIAKTTPPGLVPHYTATLVTDNDNEYILKVEYENTGKDHYWINIDPKQVCSRAYDAGVKFLKSIEYNCYPTAGGIIDMDADNICPYYNNKISDTETVTTNIKNGKGYVNPGGVNFGADIIFQKRGSSFKYTIPPYKYRPELESYKDVTWIEYPVERKFFINAGGPRDTYVVATEIYLVPEYTNPSLKKDYSNIENRVYNIFNLDDASNLSIKIRNIPRKLKGMDNHYDKYIPDKYGNLSKSIVPSDGGPIWSNPRFWNCIKVQQADDAENYKLTNPTDYLKMQNEMIFRAFFGSIDGIEHKEDILESLYPWEWIPFEYFHKS